MARMKYTVRPVHYKGRVTMYWVLGEDGKPHPDWDEPYLTEVAADAVCLALNDEVAS